MQASLGALAAASLLAGTAASTGLDQSRAMGPAGPLPTRVVLTGLRSTTIIKITKRKVSEVHVMSKVILLSQ